MRQFHFGKIRKLAEIDEKTLLITTTDRISAFDKVWCTVKDKGKVLNKTSEWWFDKTEHIIPNHKISVPSSSPRVMKVKKCKIFPVEVVVRGYITGTTNTSLWTVYDRGERIYCGIEFSDGLKKNQELPIPIVTPTTKSDDHDEPISPAQIIERGLMTEDEWNYVSQKAIELFEFGQEIAREKGLILVDTKYEFGRDVETNQIVIADELHTPDSSRYWKSDTYREKFQNGEEPDRFDKDVIRVWLRENVKNIYDDSVTAETVNIPDDVISKVRNSYLDFYKQLTGYDIDEYVNEEEGVKIPFDDQVKTKLR